MEKQKYQKRTRSKNLTLFIVTIVFLIGWTALDIYRNYQNQQSEKTLKTKVKPINAKFNIDIIDSLEKRKSFTIQELEEIPEMGRLDLNQTTPSAQLELTQPSSPSGEQP